MTGCRRIRNREESGPEENPMKRRLSAFLLLLSSCELFVTDNPRNCARVANVCSAAEYCDTVTQRCQTLDCMVNTTLCEQTEYCSSGHPSLHSQRLRGRAEPVRPGPAVQRSESSLRDADVCPGTTRRGTLPRASVRNEPSRDAAAAPRPGRFDQGAAAGGRHPESTSAGLELPAYQQSPSGCGVWRARCPYPPD
jgi:hypothetical protein